MNADLNKNEFWRRFRRFDFEVFCIINYKFSENQLKCQVYKAKKSKEKFCELWQSFYV